MYLRCLCFCISVDLCICVFLYIFVSIYPCLYFCVRVRVATVEQHSERWFLCQMGEAAGCSWEDSRFQYPSNSAKVKWQCWESVRWEDSWRLDWLTLSREMDRESRYQCQKVKVRGFILLVGLLSPNAQPCAKVSWDELRKRF